MKKFDPNVTPTEHDKYESYQISKQFLEDIAADVFCRDQQIADVEEILLKIGYLDMLKVVKAARHLIRYKEFESHTGKETLMENLKLFIIELDEKHGSES